MVQNASRGVNTRPRIVFGVTDYQSIRLLGDIPSKLAAIGWGVFVIANFAKSEAPRQYNGVEYLHIRMKRAPAPISDAIALLRWVFLLLRLKPEIVASGTPKAGLLGIAASHLTSIPHRIYVLRGLRLETEKGFFRNLLWGAEFLTCRLSTRVLAVSASLERKYTSLSITSPEKTVLLGKGSSHGVKIPAEGQAIGLRELNTQKIALGLELGIPVLGFFGRFTRDKSPEWLLATREYLYEMNVDHELLVVGPIEGCEDLLERLAQFPRATIFAGEVADPVRFMRTVDILLLPSKREGFPNVVLEASSLRIPTVGRTATGTADAILHGETGMISAEDSAKDFARLVHELLRDKAKRIKLGQRAFEWTSLNFEKNQVESLHVEFLRGLLRPH